MRERGTQSRRARTSSEDILDDWEDPGRTGAERFWQALAIIAIVVATIGWTTVAFLAMRDTTTAVLPTPSPTAATFPTLAPTLDPDLDPDFVEDLSHKVPELEALLPTTWDGIPLEAESWTGVELLGEDEWSAEFFALLEAAGKSSADLEIAQAYDPEGESDLVIGIFRVVGVESRPMRDAMIAAWGADFPDLAVTETTLGDRAVTKGVYGDGAFTSWWYEVDGAVFDIETTDEALAAAIVASLP